MKNNDNSLVVATFKDINGEVIKTIGFSKNSYFKENIIPDVATAYCLYSRKEDGKYSKDVSCQIGMDLKSVLSKKKENALLVEFLANMAENCAYAVVDGKEYVIPVEDNVKLVNNYAEFIVSLQNDLNSIKMGESVLVKKM